MAQSQQIINCTTAICAINYIKCYRHLIFWIMNLLEIAKEFMKINDTLSLTGTLMLRQRGIEIGREPSDIDLLICDYAPNVKIPEKYKEIITDCGHASDGSSQMYKLNKIKIDILSDGEQPEIVNGVRLGTVKGLISAKILYSYQKNEQARKHKMDLLYFKKNGYSDYIDAKIKELLMPLDR